MRRLIACLLVLGCGCGDDDSVEQDTGGAGAAAERGGSGGAGRSGTAGVGGAGRSGTGGAGRGGTGAPQAGVGGATRPGTGGAGREGTGGVGGAGDAYGTIKLAANVVAGQQDIAGTSQLRIGSVTGATLHSLKYYITSIQLCEDLELMGSGFNNPRGCIDLYRNMTPSSPNYETYMVEAATADTTAGHYIDLMSPEGQAALRRPTTVRIPIAAVGDDDEDAGVADGGVPEPGAQPGVYRFGLINFYRPIKVTAEFPIIGETDQYFRTKAVTMIHPLPGLAGGLGGERVHIGDTRSAPTEETVYMLNNGGALFTFQKPFAITKADVDAQAEINIDLVFNPENFGQAYESQCANNDYVPICDPVGGVAIDMPFVRMNPVPRKGGEKTRKETYLLDYEEHSQLRIELYYNDADPEKSVQGVDTAIVYLPSAAQASTPSGNTIASNFVAQSGSVRTNDASLTLMDYRHMTNLEGLRRRQDGTATIYCLFTGSVCPTLGGSVQRAYHYVADTIVSGQ